MRNRHQFGSQTHASGAFARRRGEVTSPVRKQLWLKLSGIAVAALVAVLFAAHADAGPVAPSGRTAGQRSGHGHDSQAGNDAARTGRSSAASPSASPSPDPETVLAASLSARQLAGQRVIYSYGGLTPPVSLLRLIRQGDAGGVIFFAGNYKSRPQFTAAVRELEAANASTSNPARAYPLLLMTDQEGGEVRLAARTAGQLGGLDRQPSHRRCPRGAGHGRRDERRAESARLRPQRESGSGPGRLPHGR